jgi:hypothetical protein
MVERAIAYGAVKGYVLAIDSTAFKAYSAMSCFVDLSLWLVLLELGLVAVLNP